MNSPAEITNNSKGGRVLGASMATACAVVAASWAVWQWQEVRGWARRKRLSQLPGRQGRSWQLPLPASRYQHLHGGHAMMTSCPPLTPPSVPPASRHRHLHGARSDDLLPSPHPSLRPSCIKTSAPARGHGVTLPSSLLYALPGAGVGMRWVVTDWSDTTPFLALVAAIDRKALGACVVGDEGAMKQLEALVHPLVSQERNSFLHKVRDCLVLALLPAGVDGLHTRCCSFLTSSS